MDHSHDILTYFAKSATLEHIRNIHWRMNDKREEGNFFVIVGQPNAIFPPNPKISRIVFFLLIIHPWGVYNEIWGGVEVSPLSNFNYSRWRPRWLSPKRKFLTFHYFSVLCQISMVFWSVYIPWGPHNVFAYNWVYRCYGNYNMANIRGEDPISYQFLNRTFRVTPPWYAIWMRFYYFRKPHLSYVHPQYKIAEMSQNPNQ